MASAWDQFATILRLNRTLRQAQLAREASGHVFKMHLAPLGDGVTVGDAFLSLTGPVRTRVRVSREETVAGALSGTRLHPAFLSGAFRRVSRLRGPLMRRLLGTSLPRDDTLHRINEGTLDPAPVRDGPPHGAQTFDGLPPLRGGVGRDEGLLDEDTPLQPDGETAVPEIPADRGEDLGPLLTRVHAFVAAVLTPEPHTTEDAANLEEIRTALLSGLDPEVTVPARVRHRTSFPDGLQWPEEGTARESSLEPLLVAPEFPQPMYRALAERSQDLLLPGLDRIPANTITLAENNPEFIVSYMLRLNHEMSGELLWREFPTNRRETYFRVFWETAGLAAESTPDLASIAGWDGTSELGENLRSPGTGSFLVLVIRGELLRQYPDTRVYAVPSDPGATGPDLTAAEVEVHPVFRGDLRPDVTFLGFPPPDPTNTRDSTLDQYKSGYYFIFEGPPVAPHFGLDETLDFEETEIGRSWTELEAANAPPPSEANPDPEPTGWHSIAWGDLIEAAPDATANEAALRTLTHAPVLGRLWTPVAAGTGSGLEMAQTTWGRNSAHMAHIFLQLPVRIAILARSMLEPADS